MGGSVGLQCRTVCGGEETKIRRTHRSARVEKGADAWLMVDVPRAQPTHVLTPRILGGAFGLSAFLELPSPLEY